MKPLIVAMPGQRERATRIAEGIDGQLAAMTIRSFPDGETYVRFDTDPHRRDVVVVASLHRPDEKFLPLHFIAATGRELGAESVGLVAPYLPYMRQDARFQPGEAVTSRYFCQLVSDSFDWLVTVDPHLHRLDDLTGLFSTPVHIVGAGEPIANWVEQHLEDPVLIGPDEESRQWVSAVADHGDMPMMVLQKVRHGDFEVQVTGCDEELIDGRSPVLIDDIISTGRTMIEAASTLEQWQLSAPVCVGIHGLFAADALSALRQAGIEQIVTSNSIDHPTNDIDITEVLINGVRRAMQPGASVTVASGQGS